MTSHVTSVVLNEALYRLNRVTGGRYFLTHYMTNRGKRRWYKLLVHLGDNVSGYIDEGYSADVLAANYRRPEEGA